MRVAPLFQHGVECRLTKCEQLLRIEYRHWIGHGIRSPRRLAILSIKDLVTGGFHVVGVIHLLAEAGQLQVHALAGAALVTQRAVFVQAVPGVE